MDSPRGRVRPVQAALAAAMVLLCATPALGARDVPALSGRVNDTAQMIDAATRDRLERKLEAFESQTGAQIAVLTIASLAGEPIEEYSIKAAQSWKLGRKGVDDGVLLVIARDDRQMRIEVGYGLEATLTDAHCRRINDNVLRPAFRAGDFGPGIEAGVDAIIDTLQGKAVASYRPHPLAWAFSALPFGAQLIAAGVLVLLIGAALLPALFARKRAWAVYVVVMLFGCLFMFWFFDPLWLLAIIAPAIGFPIARHWLHGTAGGNRFLANHPQLAELGASSGRSWLGGSSGRGGFFGGGGGFFGGGSGSSGGGGGFSGGGGSFGGGGSSSSW